MGKECIRSDGDLFESCMRILIICISYIPEVRSVSHLYEELAVGLVRRGHEVTVLTRYPTDYTPDAQSPANFPPSREICSGVKVIRVKGFFSHKSAIILRGVEQVLFAAKLLIRAFRVKKPDIVFVYSPPLTLAFIAAVLCVVRSSVFALNLHDFYPRTPIELGYLKNRFLIKLAQWVESYVYESARAIIVPNVRSHSILIRECGIPESKTHLIHNWVNTREIRPESKDNKLRRMLGAESNFLVSYAGLMGYAQDLSTIIACARMMKNDQNILFVLAGDGSMAERARDEAKDLSNIRFLPMLSKQEYIELLQASDVCLMPLAGKLRSPAAPGKLQSIMATGRPVIAIVPADGVAALMVREAKCGLVVEPGNVEMLRAGLRRLHDDRALAIELGANGRKAAESQFDLEGALDKFENLFGSLLQRTGFPPSRE